MKDLKLVYQAVSKEQAEVELDNLERKWGEDYPIVIKSWRENWDKLSAYFRYSDSIRKMIYTTNTVEGYHRQIRKVTKNKGVFTNDTALEKLVYLAYRNIRKSGRCLWLTGERQPNNWLYYIRIGSNYFRKTSYIHFIY